MFQVGGKEWKQWNVPVRDMLVRTQEKKGCARGSWPPTSHYGRTAGRIYATSLAVLTLEVYYRYSRTKR
jgi:hypothetical protein